MKRLAIVIDGWHYPFQPYEALAKHVIVPDGWSVDLFCVMHRTTHTSCSLRSDTEWYEIISDACDMEIDFIEYDTEMYGFPLQPGEPLEPWLLNLGYRLQLTPNTAGDIVFLQQWLDANDWERYDVVLNLHDDTLIIDDRLLVDALTKFDPWLVLANSYDPTGGPGYVRGSFEFYNRKLFEMLDGKLPIGETTLDRTGDTSSTYDKGHRYLADWNHLTEPLVEMLKRTPHLVKYLGDGYRVSQYAIEGERGFIHRNEAIPELFRQSMQKYILSGEYGTNLIKK